MPVILVIIIVVAWLVILGPNLLKRRSRTVGGISSISHFHRQLRVLEHSAPQPLVAPAYRLRSVDDSIVAVRGSDGNEVPVAPKLSVVGADQLPRPALAFLGRPPAGSETLEPAGPGSPAARAEAVPFPSGGELEGSAPGMPARSNDAHARGLARRRRRDTLTVITLVFITTLLIGFIPGATMAWAVTLVSGLALVAYVALLVRMRQMAEERERKLRYLRPAPGVADLGPAAPAAISGDSVSFGDPLADLAGRGTPRGVTDLPVRISGRYAHPSYQAVAAH
jgi:hypothetical protein